MVCGGFVLLSRFEWFYGDGCCVPSSYYESASQHGSFIVDVSLCPTPAKQNNVFLSSYIIIFLHRYVASGGAATSKVITRCI